MTYLQEEPQIIYRSKDNRHEKIFDALDWLAAMTTHIPDQGEQMFLYYGFYSILSLKLRQKENKDALIPLQSMEIHFDPSHPTMGVLYSSTSNR